MATMGLLKSAEEKAAERWWQSPPGLARIAYQKGAIIFQAEIEIGTQAAYVETMVGVGTHHQSENPTAVLNAICAEGWDLINGSVVFVFTGQSSRDKFMASGQQVAVSGRIVGYYLFRRRA